MPSIRPANRSDLEAIASLHVSSWQSAYRGILPDAVLDGLETDRRLRDWAQWLAEPGAKTVVATENKVVVGFARVVPEPDGPELLPRTGEISHLYVANDAQNHGVGRALLNISLDDIRGRDLHGAVLWVLEKNYRARAFYERAGFRLDGGRRTDPERLGSDAPEVRYRIDTWRPTIRR